MSVVDLEPGELLLGVELIDNVLEGVTLLESFWSGINQLWFLLDVTSHRSHGLVDFVFLCGTGERESGDSLFVECRDLVCDERDEGGDDKGGWVLLVM